MRIDILTTVPEIIRGTVDQSILKRAQEKGILEVNAVNLRDYTFDKHRSTDDQPYGGGPGMVMMCGPVFKAVEALVNRSSGIKPRVLLMTPQGRTFNQKMAEEFAMDSHLVMICGRYEGVDERIREHLVTDEVSVGDYVLTGGELAALIITDAVTRLLPGVLGDDASAVSESFSSGLLEYPQYTRPADFEGKLVPEVLLSGNHAHIEKWRRETALGRTLKRRPDLLEKTILTDDDRRYLDKLKASDPEEE